MKITLSTYSLRNEWKDFIKDKPEALMVICKDLGFDEIELIDFTTDTLEAIVAKLTANGVKVFGIATGLTYLVKPEEVAQTLKEGEQLIRLAHKCKIKYIRGFVGNGPLPPVFAPMEDFEEEEWAEYNEQIQQAAELSGAILDPLLKLAEELDVYLGIETHHGYSSNYIYMQEINKRFTSKHLGWIFDVGNYENDEMRWKALEEVKNRVFYVHAKMYQFDEKGFETTLDYPKVHKTLKEAGFDGKWSIEFEGKMNGLYGTIKSQELLKYCIAQGIGDKYSINVNIPTGQELIEKYNKLMK